jgi:HSP20 family protein
MKTLVKNYDQLNVLPSFLNEIFGEPTSYNWNTKLPAANIKETEEKFIIELVAPGFKKEDFKVELHERNLNISAEVKSETEEKNEVSHRKEYNFNSFSRSFRLPNSIEGENIEAVYENGVLNLFLPKKEEAKPKEPKMIAIN